ncbi:type I polyketide synthase [Bacillus velezensis]|uniref:type I polyketide synthase n=1 Tax=Bacillus velezensis TaxID=492670 RepID=UPI001F0F12BA|nr:type I polyketide synthase [Bacillus velezensis]UMQ48726.1 type I polyketide synthase [Bacillus velezensis]
MKCINEFLRTVIAQKLGAEVTEAEDKTAFFTLGVTSLISEEIMTILHKEFTGLSETLLFEYPNIEKLSEFLSAQKRNPESVLEFKETEPDTGSRQEEELLPVQAAEKVPVQETDGSSDIAVIGMSGMFPKAENQHDFWDNLMENKDCVSEIPEDRWDSSYYSEEKTAEYASYSKWGGFIDHPDQFDPLFFSVSPWEADLMDPQQKLYVTCCWEAMEDAGYGNPAARPTDQIGVFAGVTWNEYSLIAHEEGFLKDQYKGPGSLYWGIPNRVSYFLDLHGPSIAVDTACSSSLVAVHQACQAIMSGDCEMALAGGVNLSLHPQKYMFLSQSHFLSSEGKCRSFGEGGDGYVPGEGAGAVLLKPLKKAIADNDHIYGVIKGSATNHGGKTTGYTVPNPEAHRDLILSALNRAAVSPADISYIEAHGTGTALGDPIEIRGLSMAFDKQTDEKNYCGIGSVKSNIGHLEAAAGIAGLIKVLLSMKHETLPASLHSEELNRKISFSDSPFYVVRNNRPWPAEGDKPRIAAISSFGAGGSNAHLIVGAYQPKRQADGNTEQKPHAVVLSAHSEQQLKEYAGKLSSFLARLENLPSAGGYSLENIAATLLSGREPFSFRLAVIASSLSELKQRLDGFVSGHSDGRHMYFGKASPGRPDVSGQSVSDPEKFAALWVKGLQGCKKPETPYQKVPLPTYPFLKETSWLTDQKKRYTKKPQNIKRREALHPLLDENISSARKGTFQKIFSKDEYFFKDHLVNEKYVLPGVCHLEMAAYGAGLWGERPVVSLQSVWYMEPIVTGTDPRSVMIEFEAEKERISYVIKEKGADGALFSQGEVICKEKGASFEAPAFQLPAPFAQRTEPEDIYHSFSEAGIVQKDSFQVIREFSYTERKALAKLTLPSHLEADFKQYILHPSLMDGAVQTAMAHVLQFQKEPVLIVPFSFGEIQLLEPLAKTVFVHAEVKAASVHQFDLHICDERGVLLAAVKDFIIKEVQESAGFNQKAGVTPKTSRETELLMTPVWNTVTIPETGMSFMREEKIIVIGAGPDFQQALKEMYSDVRFPDITSLDSAEQMAETLKAQGSFQHMIWAAPDHPIPSVYDADTAEGQEHGVMQLFRLVKALLLLNFDTEQLSLTICTFQAQPIHEHDEVNPSHASIHGLAGSLAKEYSNWSIRLLDLESQRGDRHLPDVFSLPADSEGNPWVFRAGQWHRQQLAVCQPHADEPSLYRHGGVYVIIGGAGGIGEVWTEYMIQTYQAKIVWIGRRKKDTQIERKLKRLAALGPAPQYFSADAADYDSLKRAYDTIVKENGKVRGIIHSAIVLSDRSFANMEEDQFRASLSAKTDVSLQIARVAEGEPLDFLLFFSSMMSFQKAPGQSNYAAGCTFKDAFAKRISQKAPYAVKVVNWGFWGSVGVVASEQYRKRMERDGIASIEAPEAMKTLETLLSGPHDQLALIKTTDPVFMKDDLKEQVTVYPEKIPSALGQLAVNITQNDEAERLKASSVMSCMREMESLIEKMLASTLYEMGAGLDQALPLFQSAAGITEQYSRWLKESFVLLTELALAPEKTDLGQVWEEWERKKETWLRQKDMRAHVRLAEETLRVLPDILTGKLPATEVMFPDSSFRLVEGIYRNNIISDFFNDKLADTLIAVLKERLEKDPQAKIRILEIGAGTGGTSAAVMRKLKPYEAHIAEYCFTDISKAFLLHAEDIFGPEYPYVTYKIFNAEQPVSTEAPDIGTYDAVIATNVLHATKNIRSTLRHAKAMLQKNGQLLINEINSRTIFNHVTFGLLEGWWLYEDHDLRIPGCPGIDPAGWAEALSLEGFVHPLFPAEAAHDLGQQIIAAESDGTVRLALTQASDEKPERRPYDAEGLSDDTLHVSLREKSVELMKKVIGEALKVPAHRLLSHEPLTAYGLDSILVVRLTNALKDVFGSVSSTLFFEYQTIDELADYFLSSRKEALERQFGNGRAHPENAGRVQAPAESAAPIPNVRERGIAYLTELIGKTLKIPSGRMDPSVSLTAYGLDSILVVRLTNAFRNVFDQMTSTLFFEYQTIEEIADYLLLSQRGAFMKAMGVREAQLADHTDNLNVKQNKIPQNEEGSRTNGDPYIQDIAVIGLSGRYPGADHVDELWENVKAGRHSITEVPKDRWDWKTFYNEERGKWGSIYSKWGGFLDDIDKFDPLFFRISPAEAERMDPQERLFLQTAYSSIEDAGYTPATLCDSRKIGVFVGVMNSNYPTVPSDWSIANRVSFLFNFQGPSMAVDTACSSSLTAVHLAAESLRSGMSETAIAGGVNLIVDPAHYERLSAFSMLSPGDKCKSFGDSADGFVDGEGVGAIVLKPLAQAEKDGDHIYGVIKGSMLNAAGRTNAYMVPNPKAQFDLIAETLKRTDIHPRTVSYLEAHGTGTALGDPIEIDGLTKAFRLTTEDRQFCSIGSIKSNIGHLESAAGIAGITKLLLQLKHKRIAPSLHAAELNPNIEFEHTPFFVQQKETEWKRPVLNITGKMKEYPRIAGISSFGAGGSNAHVIIQEYVPSDSLKPMENASVSPQKPAVIILSARNEQQLSERARQLLDDVIRKKRSDGDLAKIAYTLQAGREPMAERLAFTAESIEELKMKLMSFSNDHNIEHAHIWRGRTAKHHSLAASLTSDEDMALTINAWLRKGKYGKLLDLWVKGLDVDWSALYQCNPGRISLPAYPFAKDRYWVTKADVSLDKTGSAKSEKAARLHPLLHANTSTFTAQRFTSVFSGHEPFFADHIVNGKPVLPGAAALEMARAAVTFAAEDLPGGKTGVTDGEGPIEDRYDACAAELSAIVTRLIKEKQKKKTLIQLLVPDRGEDNVLAGLAAFLKTAHLEHPKLYGQVIQADPDESASSLLAKLKENRAHPEQAEIRYEDGKRLVRNWRHLPAPQSGAVPWKDEGVYLLTGGAGGIGLIVAEEIASRVKNAVLVLTGRAEALDKDRSARLRRLEASGARVLYQPVDVTDRAAVIALVRGIQEVHGTLDGIIHGAGVIADNYILNQTENERKTVMAPKVKGLINLDEAAKDVRLDFFILFSSLAGGMGNPGQAGYAAANAFMDVYAARRNRLVRDNRRSGQTLSVNWPLWEEGGMRVDKETERLMYEQTGMKAMRSASGIQALYAAFASGEHQVMVAEGDEKRIRKNLMPETPEPSNRIHVSRKTPVHMPNKVQAELKHMISGILKVKEDEIDAESEMRDYGFDSVSFTQFANELNKTYGLELTPAVFFEYPTVFRFAQYLLTEHPDTFGSQAETEKPVVRKKMKTEPFLIPSRLPKTKTAAAPEPVAIIGISCAFPMAENPEMFWENLAGEKDCISEIPPERWDWRQYYGDPQKDKNASNVKWGGFIDETAQFDPLFFGISPHEAEMMDPQQRLLMMHVWKAIEDAGCSAKSLSGTNTGIFAGTTNSGYAQEASKFHIEIEGSSAAGTVPSIGPNRMSYFLNIHGPSEPIETACSSSLVAVHRAVRAIQAGDCGIAIAGGVNAIVSPDMHISFNKAGMLSEDGRCKTFSDQADGYVRAEGAGMIVLKTLSDAERDGDRIYAVIRGTAENHGGRAASLTSPNPKAQTEVMIKAYQQANIDPRTVSYIEAHGTGTALGDPIEINGLKAAFAALYQKAGVTAPDQPHCAIGSVKTNIGHTELAAGMAGLLKIILQMQHKTLVKSLHCETVNPYISLDGSPFYFVRDTQPWKAATDDSGNELPRRAGVSSFGFGGVNAHVVLEEYVSPVEEKQWTVGELQPSLFILSAKTAEQLKERAEQLCRYLEKTHSADGALAGIAYTLQLGRDEMEERLAVIAETKEELTNALNDFLSGKETGQNFFTGRNKAMKQLFTEMTDNAEMSGTVDQWIEAGKYTMLAKLWVQGLHVDWNKLYPDERPKKVSLPVYPFAKTHCWIPHSAQHIRHRETYETDTSPLETYERLLDELEKNEISIEAAVKRTIGFYRD